MPFALPPINREQLAQLSSEPLSDRALDALLVHYQELSVWNQRLSLIGPGTLPEILERHYGESLAALSLIPETARHALDVGSGAGFPGVVLAAARPEMEVTLVEARERKWAFLSAAARKASLPCRCLNVRVEVPLPAGLPASLDVVTARALKLESDVLGALAERLGPEGRVLLWVGEDDPPRPPQLVPGRTIRIPGSRSRRILELRPKQQELR
ncbi:MAG TPA: RsmG family class I SAM-dependent methyltransferase [Thermoanaerobaculia bacterium]|jgi:16S rRNA (guanine527-N7)-methyltransferase|nr:RsmG family class I SAM-dependent methyltransferase [Thermoanaerobaculia bacterium]